MRMEREIKTELYMEMDNSIVTKYNRNKTKFMNSY